MEEKSERGQDCWVAAANLQEWKKSLKEAKTAVSYGAAAAAADNDVGYIFRVCVCSPSYPTCKAHAPYYIVICDLSGFIMLFHIVS